MGPVRVGNQAYEHFQHDIYGNIVLGAAQAFLDQRLFRRADAADFAELETIGEQAWRAARPARCRHVGAAHARARAHLVVADVLGRLRPARARSRSRRRPPERAAFWRERADVIRGKILEHAWSEKRQAFVESFGGSELDASVLLMAEVGFIAPNDPRFVRTVDAMEKALCDGPFMRRYEAADDFGRPETAFNVCSFWRVDALARIGRRDEAREIFEALLAAATRRASCREDMHAGTGELWGNFPQTYSMVGIINGARAALEAVGHDGVSVAEEAPYPRLLGDVGGTGVRFAWIAAAGVPLVPLAAAPGPPAAGLEAAIRAALEANGLASPPSCALGVAAAVTGDRVAMTNRDWTFSVAGLRRSLGVARLLVLNDFAALGHAIDGLQPGEARRVGGGSSIAGANVALLGPGTGLGVGGLLRTAEGTTVLVGEGGHASLAAGDEREAAVIALLRRRLGHASAESVLSGPGLANLHAAVCALDGRPSEPLDARRIAENAATDPSCAETLGLFFAFLGAFAGDLALTLGARGGVYVAGGIVARLGTAIDNSAFRERFEAKGRRRAYLAAISTAVILDTPALALRGADAALGRMPA